MRTRLLLLAAGLPLLIAAEPPSPPAPAPAERAAFVRSLAEAPMIQAARDRIAGSQRSVAAAGRLPDPMVGVGFARKSTAMQRWPMYDVDIEQPLPRWGERDARRAKALAEAALDAAELQEALGEMAADVAMLLADADAGRARLALVDGQVARAASLQAIIAARVAAGTAGIAEQLAVQSRIAALAVERDTVQRGISDAEQDVRGRLGLAPTAPLPAFAAPRTTDVVTEQVPGVLAAQARTADADAMFREARASRYPETAIGLRYEREEQPGDPMDTVGVVFRVSLPVWQRASADLEDAAAARRRAARRDADGWRYRAQALLGRAERAAQVASTARTAAEATKARLDAESEALIRAASTQGGSNLASVLDVLDRVSDAERLVIDAEAAARQADAGLWRIAPPVLPTTSPPRNQP